MNFVYSFVDVWVLAEVVGVKLHFPENSAPSPIESHVRNLEDVERLEVPDRRRDGRLPMVERGKAEA